MDSSQHRRTIMHVFSIVFSLVVSAGFTIGVISGLHHIIGNYYFEYDMIRSVGISFQGSITYWIMLSLICCLLLLPILCVLVLIAKLALSQVVEMHVKHEHTVVRTAVTLVLFSVLLVLGGWASNHYWLRGISLLANSLIVLFAVFMAWVFMRIPWERKSGVFRAIKRMTIVFVVILLALNLWVVIDGKVNTPSSPNVVFIIVDTLRADHLSCYGYNRNTSPNIDTLATQGVFFENAISAASWTTPSIASILSSQYPAVLGFTDGRPVRLGDKFLTLAEVLRENNYETKGIISHTFLSSALGFDQGFDSYDEDNARGEGHISSVSLVDKAIEFLETHQDKTFLLFLHCFDPHNDYILHEAYDYYPDYDGCVHSGQPLIPLRNAAPCMRENDIRYLRALYDSEISFTDRHLGRLIDKLRELDLFEDTLIVFTADHGEAFLERGDHWIGHSKTLYQEQIHIPLVTKLPWKHEGRIIDEYVGLIDLMPTIIDCIDLRIPEQYQHEGHAFDLTGEDGVEERPIVSETTRRAKLRSVIWGDWKLIQDIESGAMEFYNLGDDPGELRDVALEGDPLLEEMEAILVEWSDYVTSRKAGTEARPPQFTEEQIERLRSLGYID